MEELYYAFEITPFIENFENKHFYIVVISHINMYALKIFLIKMSVWIKFLLASVIFFFLLTNEQLKSPLRNNTQM